MGVGTKNAQHEGGDDSSDGEAQAFGNEGLEVERLGVGEGHGDQKDDAPEDAKDGEGRAGGLHVGKEEQDWRDGEDECFRPHRQRGPSQIGHCKRGHDAADHPTERVEDAGSRDRGVERHEHAGDEHHGVGTWRTQLPPDHLGGRASGGQAEARAPAVPRKPEEGGGVEGGRGRGGRRRPDHARPDEQVGNGENEQPKGGFAESIEGENGCVVEVGESEQRDRGKGDAAHHEGRAKNRRGGSGADDKKHRGTGQEERQAILPARGDNDKTQKRPRSDAKKPPCEQPGARGQRGAHHDDDHQCGPIGIRPAEGQGHQEGNRGADRGAEGQAKAETEHGAALTRGGGVCVLRHGQDLDRSGDADLERKLFGVGVEADAHGKPLGEAHPIHGRRDLRNEVGVLRILIENHPPETFDRPVKHLEGTRGETNRHRPPDLQARERGLLEIAGHIEAVAIHEHEEGFARLHVGADAEGDAREVAVRRRVNLRIAEIELGLGQGPFRAGIHGLRRLEGSGGGVIFLLRDHIVFRKLHAAVEALLGVHELRLPLPQIGLRNGDSVFVVRRVNFEEQLAALDLLVIGHGQRDDGAFHPRRDGDDVRPHVGVPGPGILVILEVEQPGEDEAGYERRGGDDDRDEFFGVTDHRRRERSRSRDRPRGRGRRAADSRSTP